MAEEIMVGMQLFVGVGTEKEEPFHLKLMVLFKDTKRSK
jgi:hypothetical protein